MFLIDHTALLDEWTAGSRRPRRGRWRWEEKEDQLAKCYPIDSDAYVLFVGG